MNQQPDQHDEPRVVALGGGTGLSNLLRGLKRHTSRITAIVTVADDGGSSGRIRRQLGVLPPGDIRNCMVALADDDTMISSLFKYRFDEGELSGHSLGNLMLAAMAKMTGDFGEAVRRCGELLNIRGQVVPATLQQVSLQADLADGSRVSGQAQIAGSARSCRRVWLEPAGVLANPEAVAAIRQADLIVIGPGSLYTSIIPTLLIQEVAAAVSEAGCQKLFVCNIMTQPGETLDFSAADHLGALNEHVGASVADAIIVNTNWPPDSAAGAASAARPVLMDEERIREMGVELHAASLVSGDDYFHHDGDSLAAAVLSLYHSRKCPSPPQ